MNHIERRVIAVAAIGLTLGLTLGLNSVAEARTPLPPAGEDGVVFMNDENPAMAKAFARARRELDQFLKLAAAPAAHQRDFAVKVGLVVGEETEYVWINEIKPKPGGKFVGVINNEVELTDKFKLGDSHTFAKSEIVDWTYIDTRERRMHGNYTLCALLTQEPADQAEEYRRKFKLDCQL